MWRWQPSALFKRIFPDNAGQLFFGQLCLATFVGHLLVLLVCVLWSWSTTQQQKFIISTQKQNLVYVLSPLKKRIASSTQTTSGSKKMLQSSKVIDYQTYQNMKKNRRLGKKVLQKKEQKVSNKKQKESVKKREQPLKKTTKASKGKASLQLIESVAVSKADKKNSSKKKELAKQAAAVKSEPEVQTPVADIEPAQEVKTIEKNDLTTAESEAESDQMVADDFDLDDVVHVGYEQLDSLGVLHTIQNTIQQHFKAPIGLKKGVCCELSVVIDKDGKPQAVTIAKPSGIILYDRSARAMLYDIDYPLQVWNKTITIVLGQ